MMNKKGVALISSILIAAIFLIVSTALATTIITESRMTLRSDQSVVAYSAARSGVEWAKVCIDSSHLSGSTFVGGTCLQSAPIAQTDSGDLSFASGATYRATIQPSNPHPGTTPWDTFSVSSMGKYQGITRKLEFTITKEAPNIFDNPVTLNASNLTESFTLQYDFWRTNSTALVPRIGITNGTDKIFMTYDPTSGRVDLSKTVAGVTTSALTPITVSGTDPAGTVIDEPNAYNFRAEISYKKGALVTLTLKKRILATGLYECIGSVYISMAGEVMNNLNIIETNGTFTSSSDSFSSSPHFHFGTDLVVARNFKLSGLGSKLLAPLTVSGESAVPTSNSCLLYTSPSPRD